MNFESGGAKKLLMLAAGLLVGAGIGLFGLVSLLGISLPETGENVPQAGVAVPAPSIGSLAPDFELADLSGKFVRLSDLQGKPVLINFWATWCAPCRTEMPAFQRAYDQYGQEFEILAVNFAEPEEAVQAFVDELEITFPVLLDPQAEVQGLYRVRGYPTTVLIDQTGVVQIYHVGYLSETQLQKYFSDLGVGE
jgi:peroxiredoxin